MFLSGIQDLNANYTSAKPTMLIMYKFPLKSLKAIDNQIAKFDCTERFN